MTRNKRPKHTNRNEEENRKDVVRKIQYSQETEDETRNQGPVGMGMGIRWYKRRLGTTTTWLGGKPAYATRPAAAVAHTARMLPCAAGPKQGAGKSGGKNSKSSSESIGAPA